MNSVEFKESEVIDANVSNSNVSNETNEAIESLYQELIIDHGMRPRNFRTLENATAQAEGFNPLCGDKINLYLTIEDQKIKDICFKGHGCAISTASASLMSEMLRGKDIEEATELFDRFKAMLTCENSCKEGLGKLTALSGVRTFPMRVKCATLAWHTFNAALNTNLNQVTTE